MDKIDVNQPGGFPMTTNTLNAMQNAYNVFNSLGTMAGNYVIISGCEIVGNSVKDGFVFIDGEVFLFKGGTQTSKVRIIEKQEIKQFKDGSSKAVIFKRHVEFGTSIEDIEWSKFKRPKNLFQLEDKDQSILNRVEKLEKQNEKLEECLKKTVPLGLVAVWGRYEKDIPEGWREYKGLIKRVPVGYDKDYLPNNDSVDYKLNEKGAEGGFREVQLKESELPKLEGTFMCLSITDPTGIVKRIKLSGSSVGGRTSPGWYHIEQKIEFGKDKPHTNMQPYKVVEFIEFVGFE